MATTKFTLAQYQTLAASYAQGVTRVKYGDKEIDYMTRENMKAILREMEVELGIKAPVRTKYLQHTKGLQ